MKRTIVMIVMVVWLYVMKAMMETMIVMMIIVTLVGRCAMMVVGMETAMKTLVIIAYIPTRMSDIRIFIIFCVA